MNKNTFQNKAKKWAEKNPDVIVRINGICNTANNWSYDSKNTYYVPSMKKKLVDILKKESVDTSKKEHKMKLKVGDKVLLRDDLVSGKVYGECLWVNDMEKFNGSVVTVRKILKEVPEDNWARFYIYENIGYTYTTDMIKKILQKEKEHKMELKVGDVVLLRDDLVHNDEYGKHVWISSMKKNCLVTVKESFLNFVSFRIKEESYISYMYTPSMVKKIVDIPMAIKSGDTVIIRDDLIDLEVYGYSDWNKKMRCGSSNPVTVTNINYDMETFNIEQDVYVYSFQMIKGPATNTNNISEDTHPSSEREHLPYIKDQIDLHTTILNDIYKLINLCDGLGKNKSKMNKLLFEMLELLGVK